VFYRSVLILGLGRSGKEAALLLRDKGAKVTVAERERNFFTLRRKEKLKEYGAEVVFGFHQNNLLEGKDLIVLSPGISGDLPVIKKALSSNIPVVGELEVASWFIPRKNIIAVTGTNGKTTTTFLIYKVLKRGGLPVEIGGNIGVPLSRLARTYPYGDPSRRLVIEVSSFQLEVSDTFSPHIYCILNITPDHLDRHHSFSKYREIKAKPIFKMKRDDFVILNYDQQSVRSLGELTRAETVFFSQKEKLPQGVFIDNGSIVVNIFGDKFFIPLGNLQIHKFHSWENVLCAVACSVIQGVNPEIVRDTLVNYNPLPHRQEFIAEISEVKFVNDSKATNQAAVENMIGSLEGPCVLIMGGKDKGSDFSILRKYIPDKIKGLVVTGEAGERIIKQLEGISIPVKKCEGLKEAVRIAFSLSKKGDHVVLSPGCSSFDEFKSYRHRGRVFKKEVERLRREIEREKSV